MRVLTPICVLLAGCSLVNNASEHRGGQPDAWLAPDAAVIDSGSDAGLAPVDPAQFCTQLAEIACEAHRRCCPSGMDLDVPMCIDQVEVACATYFGQVAADPRAGYSREGAARVLAEGRRLAESCDPAIAAWYSEPTGLFSVFDGSVPGGEECTPRMVAGGDLAAFVSCEQSNQACVQVTTAYWTCQSRRPAAAPCWVFLDCQPGLYCAGGFLGVIPGTCTPRLPNGSPCGSGGDCQSLLCVIPMGMTMGTCQPATFQTAYCGVSAIPGM